MGSNATLWDPMGSYRDAMRSYRILEGSSRILWGLYRDPMRPCRILSESDKDCMRIPCDPVGSYRNRMKTL
eukprot:1637958-Pyramimonas_sp.AAC.1